jgi:glutathione S-transferase
MPSRSECAGASGHDFEKVVFARGIPFGLFTKGRRPELKAISGQEKLPVLRLMDGTTISGSADIIAWAKATEPVAPGGYAASAVSPRDPKEGDD